MSEKQNLGLFWGHNSLFFVETVGTSPKRFFSVPIMQDDSIVPQIPAGPKAVNHASLISNSFRKQNLELALLNLALPTRDIIFRSFIIPWMQSHELKGVVAFEASKYIPFSLEDLSYSFYPITMNVEGTRRIRIILVAIKKSSLENYISTLEQSNLSIGTIEPAFLSLIRCLNVNNAISPTQTVAIIEKRADSGEIIIVNRGVPQFVRELALTNPGTEPPSGTSSRLLNEIRISLDYFNRQENQLHVDQILYISSSASGDLAKNLETDLGIASKALSIQSIMGNNKITEPDYIKAFGAGIIDSVELPVSFEFNTKKTSQSRMKGSSIKKVANFQSILITAGTCILVNLIAWFITKGFVTGPGNEIASLRQQMGSYEGVEVDKLNATTKTNIEKLTVLKQLQKDDTVSLLLKTLPRLLPEGVWIKSMDITEAASRKEGTKEWSFAINGFAFSKNSNKQFQLVTKLQQNMLTDKNFIKYFGKNVSIEDLKAQKIEEYDVVYFKVRCLNK